jgi:sugar phosphate isomerase/epimerase
MQIGLLTAPFGNEPLEVVAEFAGKAGFGALEIIAGPGSKHVDVTNLTSDRVSNIRKLMLDNNLEISSLAYYTNITDTANRETIINNLKATVDAAHEVGTSVVCTLAGMPVAGKDKMQTIEEDCAAVFHPVVEYASTKGIKIALENWFATNIQNLAHWEKMFQVVPHENFGLNFDPSHLLWQGIDYIEAVHRFGQRIFHAHAKDTEIKEHVLREVGNQAGGWWRYVIPGFGKVRWGEFVYALRSVGFDGALSIEHEDGRWGREEGFIKGKEYLKLFV